MSCPANSLPFGVMSIMRFKPCFRLEPNPTENSQKASRFYISARGHRIRTNRNRREGEAAKFRPPRRYREARTTHRKIRQGWRGGSTAHEPTDHRRAAWADCGSPLRATTANRANQRFRSVRTTRDKSTAVKSDAGLSRPHWRKQWAPNPVLPH